MRWSILDGSFDDRDNIVYGQAKRLNYLLNTARETSLANIAMCKERGLICVQAMRDFEDAEMHRDDKDEDKVSVLIAYWKASLEAKAFLMLMAVDNSPEPKPQRAVMPGPPVVPTTMPNGQLGNNSDPHRLGDPAST